MIEIINNQRKIKISTAELQDFAAQVVKAVFDGDDKTLTVAFISDRKMLELNKQFRGKNSTTDVLSFPYEAESFEAEKNNLGELLISAEQAARQAMENNLAFDAEIKQLILHGVLHLGGYDHETDNGEMNAKELELRDKLDI